MNPKLLTAWVLSSLIAILAANVSRAHEVIPTIGDLAVVDGRVALDLRLNLEAFVAGIDLDGLEDTDATAQSDTYDALRALDPETLEQRFRAIWPQLAEGMTLTGDGQRLPLSLETVIVPPVGNPDLPRTSEIALSATMPSDAAAWQFGWSEGFGTVVLRQQGVEDPYSGYLQGGEATPDIPIEGGVQMTAWEAFASYIPIGFEHILPLGLDHILFVLGLFFLSARLSTLLWQVSAFTLAHTVTLALGAVGLVSVPGSIVEPLIAASIVYVAVENIMTNHLTRWRPFVIFGFGLLHGLGFASVLGEFGLPAGQFVPALLGFNIGVELGQITVIAIAFLLVGAWFRNRVWYRSRIAVPASCIIALIGAYWFVERVFL